MHLSVAIQLFILSAATALTMDASHALEKRGSDVVSWAGCTATFGLCMTACRLRTREATHVRQACNAHCLVVFERQIREADNYVPADLDAPSIAKRDLAALRDCNNSMQTCVDSIVKKYGRPEAGTTDPDTWELEMGFCQQFYDACKSNAGYGNDNTCPET
ncbi:hypothetical protein TI39_contig801g00002 [Zymoseptoria brevis]|uniref:Uncharacterized protein n=1 Tax=Zymoseptoria brevis TaxID=1047168 RepID=A0A0F4GFT8_9PEZI|nr:hypothetical protein TI39_contig801g00002 [Zymoseptoria brevis]